MIGFFRSVPLAPVAAFLTRIGAFGLGLAVATGFWLFTVRPVEYLGNAAFLWKLGLLGLAMLNITWQHGSRGLGNTGAAAVEAPTPVRVRAVLSLTLWLAILLAGRWIGFL